MPDEQVWVADNGPEIDEDDDQDWPDYDEYDHLDDEPTYEREEPYCGACNDHGCRRCETGRLRAWWWSVRSWRRRRRANRHWRLHPDEPPF